MKLQLTLEDTHEGIRYTLSGHFNGQQDGAERSLSVMLAARFENCIAELQKARAIVVDRGHEPNALFSPPRR